VALADPDGREIEGTRQPWKGDTGYSWEGAKIGRMVVASGILVCHPLAIQERVARVKPSDVLRLDPGNLDGPIE
jgi:hypothetical protein